jgi:hypothetical protein
MSPDLREKHPNVILFLDPDTGIERRSYNRTHVRWDELLKLYGALKPGDILVIYQHAPHEKGWHTAILGRIEDRLKQKGMLWKDLFYVYDPSNERPIDAAMYIISK